MARVTVEDCVLKVPNRFELVLLAAQRAREISSGVPLSIDRDDDKNPVVALREIADETVGLPHLKESLVRGMQKQVEVDEPDETSDIEIDPSVFAAAAAGPALLDEDGEPDASELGEFDDEDEINEDETAASEPAFAADADALAEELAEDDLAVEGDIAAEDDLTVEDDLAVEDGLAGADDLAGAEEERVDLGDIAGAAIPGADIAEDDLSGDDEEL